MSWIPNKSKNVFVLLVTKRLVFSLKIRFLPSYHFISIFFAGLVSEFLVIFLFSPSNTFVQKSQYYVCFWQIPKVSHSRALFLTPSSEYVLKSCSISKSFFGAYWHNCSYQKWTCIRLTICATCFILFNSWWRLFICLVKRAILSAYIGFAIHFAW